MPLSMASRMPSSFARSAANSRLSFSPSANLTARSRRRRSSSSRTCTARASRCSSAAFLRACFSALSRASQMRLYLSASSYSALVSSALLSSFMRRWSACHLRYSLSSFCSFLRCSSLARSLARCRRSSSSNARRARRSSISFWLSMIRSCDARRRACCSFLSSCSAASRSSRSLSSASFFSWYSMSSCTASISAWRAARLRSMAASLAASTSTRAAATSLRRRTAASNSSCWYLAMVCFIWMFSCSRASSWSSLASSLARICSSMTLRSSTRLAVLDASMASRRWMSATRSASIIKSICTSYSRAFASRSSFSRHWRSRTVKISARLPSDESIFTRSLFMSIFSRAHSRMASWRASSSISRSLRRALDLASTSSWRMRALRSFALRSRSSRAAIIAAERPALSSSTVTRLRMSRKSDAEITMEVVSTSWRRTRRRPVLPKSVSSTSGPLATVRYVLLMLARGLARSGLCLRAPAVEGSGGGSGGGGGW
mmetsp:Transcript_36898/g.115553  ORF Transcript_36898/g.115553 Transcript_36898/m.115553 type:complete len:489 (-) Transcript_36898:60-1526(-)